MNLAKTKCKECNKNTLAYPDNEVWTAWKDRTKCYCENCNAAFNIRKDKLEVTHGKEI